MILIRLLGVQRTVREVQKRELAKRFQLRSEAACSSLICSSRRKKGINAPFLARYLFTCYFHEGKYAKMTERGWLCESEKLTQISHTGIWTSHILVGHFRVIFFSFLFKNFLFFLLFTPENIFCNMLLTFHSGCFH